MALKVCVLGAVRRRTFICCRNVRISASSAARNRIRSTTIQTMSLTRSLIPQQHRPILDQLLVRLSLRQGQPKHENAAPDRDDITATELAVDRQIEHGEVPSAAFDLEFGPDRPDVWVAAAVLPRSPCPCSKALDYGAWASHELDPAWSYSSVTEGEKHVA